VIFERFVVGTLETNSYVFGDEESKEVAVIDPGGETDTIKRYIKKNGLKLKYIINTHGHGDHIGGNGDFDVDILIHEADKDFLMNPGLNLSTSFGTQVKSPRAACCLQDGDKIKVGKLELEVIHTPGHTPGGICLKHNGILFSGDTLFFEGVGRTDLPHSSWEDLLRAIRARLMSLPDTCVVYPGHGPETNIGHERESNTFI